MPLTPEEAELAIKMGFRGRKLDDTPRKTDMEKAGLKRPGCCGVSICSCRLPHWVADPGRHCTHQLETCLFMGDVARWGSENRVCRLIIYEQAIEIVHRPNQDGLVHTHDFGEFVCNCCVDCCVFFVSQQLTGAIPLAIRQSFP